MLSSRAAAPGAPLAAILILIIIITQVAPIHAAKQCYWMDGTITDNVVQPCNPDADVSPCCALNKPKPDLCLSSGLCYAQDSGVEGFLYSDGCTDRSGEDERCPHFCFDRTEKRAAYNVLQCEAGNPSSQFCCRASSDNKNCCGNKTALLSTSIGTIVFPTKATSSTTGGPSTLPTATTTPGLGGGLGSSTCGPPSSEACPKDKTAVVGGAVGGVLGAALLVALGVIALLVMRRPVNKEHHHQAPAAAHPDHQTSRYTTPNLHKELPPPGYPPTASSRGGMQHSPMGMESARVHAQELPVQQVHEAQ
ncbi:hypothetical protein JDV02_007291 [Purpureocillium takamizusanense]|uniref:Uncharacterized protein n=1 Tax=Purpureocillium takamizusanense TaxID=2060973 RepID=A0A9Q8VDW9_9HYPO|nr:uncharacterized protein JDV02_007291 [Purpureocillium takamizusanense]UNI21289.1 hypothetical protein JDV02_007291 [Purpureocillium takamizusanense]